MKIIGRILAVLLVLALVLGGVLLAARYGWKVFGFRACQDAAILSVDVVSGSVHIRGTDTGSFPRGFCGYYAEEGENKLYVGFRFSSLWGWRSGGDFDVTIPVEGQINQVILKTGTAERSIWTAESETAQQGIYVKMDRGDVYGITFRWEDTTSSWETADSSPLASGQWYYSGNKIGTLSRKEGRPILFSVSAQDAQGNILTEGSFYYNVAQERLYVTVTTQGVYCGTGQEDLFDVPQVLSLPILDTVESEVALGTAGSSLRAVKTATELMDWAVDTDLEMEAIENAAAAWLNAKGDAKEECRLKLELVDNVYQELLTAKAQELLDTAGCADTPITWGREPLPPVEAVMRGAGLRSGSLPETE